MGVEIQSSRLGEFHSKKGLLPKKAIVRLMNLIPSIKHSSLNILHDNKKIYKRYFLPFATYIISYYFITILEWHKKGMSYLAAYSWKKEKITPMNYELIKYLKKVRHSLSIRVGSEKKVNRKNNLLIYPNLGQYLKKVPIKFQKINL